jgi:hypothetical protein
LWKWRYTAILENKRQSQFKASPHILQGVGGGWHALWAVSGVRQAANPLLFRLFGPWKSIPRLPSGEMG